MGLKVHDEYTFRGSNSAIYFFATGPVRGQLLKQRICSRSKFFLLRVDPFVEWLLHPGKEI